MVQTRRQRKRKKYVYVSKTKFQNFCFNRQVFIILEIQGASRPSFQASIEINFKTKKNNFADF